MNMKKQLIIKLALMGIIGIIGLTLINGVMGMAKSMSNNEGNVMDQVKNLTEVR